MVTFLVTDDLILILVYFSNKALSYGFRELGIAPFTLHVGPGKLPECLLCERKHVPGLIPGLIPGWGPSNIVGFSPGTSAVWTKAGSMP